MACPCCRCRVPSRSACFRAPVGQELEAPGPNGAPPAGIRTPLVDEEGFPRADIDVYNVRHKRHQLALLRTDHSAIMKQIEGLLYEHHASTAVPKPTSTAFIPAEPKNGDASAGSGAGSQPTRPSAPVPVPVSTGPADAFAVIDQVAAGSPAWEGGLRVGDKVVRFGEAHAQNHRRLAALADIVRGNVGRPIDVLVERRDEFVPLQLTPNTWSGNGVLGCHFSPV